MNPEIKSTAVLNTVNLDILKLRMRRYLGEHLAYSNVSYNTIFDDHLRSIVLEMEIALAGRKLEPVEVSYPADWWEAFKARWFHWRLKRLWPVRHKVEKIEFATIYPDLQIEVPTSMSRHTVVFYGRSVHDGW